MQYINHQSRENDVVYVIDGSWLIYYFKPRAIDMFGMLQGIFRPVVHWPENKAWLGYLKSQNVTWIYVNYVSPQTGVKINKGSTPPYWPEYPLVYSDNESWVFRYSQAPDNSGDTHQ